ncbi:hypothetical protein ACFQZE_23375 [Paenibacillus sp. GCM10027627]|uniref:hypothetical protein n=1 Tax=unclassified Paenibacillus TaxID=185978 RepID=UPI0036346450
MEKINLESVVKSFFLGLLIGVVLQVYDEADVQLSYKVLSVLASGSIGFIIGLVTEWLTSKLPVSLAKVRTYFFINNLIALMVAAFIMALLIMISGSDMETEGGFTSLFLIVLGMICLANLFDYMMYRRAQHKLESFKSSIK